MPVSALDKGATLDVGTPVHDFASVFLDGQLAGRMERSSQGDTSLVLPAQTGEGSWSLARLGVCFTCLSGATISCHRVPCGGQLIAVVVCLQAEAMVARCSWTSS